MFGPIYAPYIDQFAAWNPYRSLGDLISEIYLFYFLSFSFPLRPVHLVILIIFVQRKHRPFWN